MKQQGNVSMEKGSESGLTLLKLSIPPIFLVVLLVLGCGYAAYLQYADTVKQAQQVQYVADAEKMAAQLGGRVIALGAQVAAQARADAVLVEAIEQHDSEALRGFEEGLQGYFPEALRIRVITPADTEPDMSVEPPVRYACLELARKAEGGTDRPPLELHLPGSDDVHLDLVRPIKHQGVVIASLMVSFNTESIAKWLEELDPQGGFVELQQEWEGPILGSTGDESMKAAKATHRAVVDGSSWQLSYWPNQGLGMADAKKLGFLAIFGGGALLIAVVMLIYARYVSGVVRRDLAAMAEFMLQSSRGKRFHSYPVKMSEMEQAITMMEPVLHQAQKPRQEVKTKGGQDAEKIPDMTFMDFGEITVEEGKGSTPPQEGEK